MFLIIAMCNYTIQFIKQPVDVRSKSNLIDFVNTSVILHDSFIDLYGFTQRLFGKRQVENFTIFKTNYEKLEAPRKELSEEDIVEKLSKLAVVIDYVSSKEIPYYYIDSILPIQNIEDLPKGVKEGSHYNKNLLNHKLNEKGYRIIELQELPLIRAVPKEKLFYRTDHHWTMNACFASYCEIINRIENDYGFELAKNKTVNTSNYSELFFSNTFLGSYGVKVGKYYAGKDDFAIYIPKYDTGFVFESYDSEGNLVLKKRGDFYNALIDANILNDDLILNKYNAFCNRGYVENRIINLKSPNDLKCLYISHSYGRPLTMYLANNFKEIVNLDPQDGRFAGDYFSYIDDFSPDIVLFQCEFEGEIVGTYNTGR